MKIAYTISGIYNSGGMENILLQKANYLADVLGYDVSIITTDQDNRPPFFHLSDRIRHIDININYYKYKSSMLWHIKRLILQRSHKTALTKVLSEEQFDIVISLMDFDFTFLYKINDGSKKLIEYHFSKYAKALASKNFIIKVIQRIRACYWNLIVRKYDKFIVLTDEDKKQWGDIENMIVIPNFINQLPSTTSTCESKRVISVGRMDFQKGFDLLIKAWRIVNLEYPEWRLAIIGGGDKSRLNSSIEKYQLQKSVQLLPPTKNIGQEYLSSSLYVMSSRYEGLPLVLLEALSYGLPVVTFECPCGPRDIIKPEFGTLVACYDTKALAHAIISWIQNRTKRLSGSAAASVAAKSYLKEPIMKRWDVLFQRVLRE